MHELKTVTLKELRGLPDYKLVSYRTLRRLKASILDYQKKEKTQPLTVNDIASYFAASPEAVFKQLFPDIKGQETATLRHKRTISDF